MPIVKKYRLLISSVEKMTNCEYNSFRILKVSRQVMKTINHRKHAYIYKFCIYFVTTPESSLQRFL